MSDLIYNFVKGQLPIVQWFLFLAMIFLGFYCLVKFANIFVDSASTLAKILRIPTIIVGLTIVSIGTSAPELSVSMIATINGSSGISVGNILGADIFKILVVLSASAFVAPVALKKSVVKRDFLVMLFSSILLLIFVLINTFGNSNAIVWIEGLIMIAVFIIYVAVMINHEKHTEIARKVHRRKKREENSKSKIFITIILLIFSVVGIVFGGTFVNVGAKGIAVNIGASETLAGLTVCAIGASLPEFVTSVVAMRRGENDIAIGNVVGANILNILMILGLCSFVAPQTFDLFALIDLIIMITMFMFVYVYSLNHEVVGKKMATFMIILYILYFAFIIVREYVPIF